MTEKTDIVDTLLMAVAETNAAGATRIAMSTEILKEAAETIVFLRLQSRGHFEAMTAVLRDGIEAILPETPPKRQN